MNLSYVPILAADNPVSHVVNHKFWATPDGVWLWSGNVGNLILSGIILILGFRWIASRIDTGPEADGNERFVTKGNFASMIEVICVYLRDRMVRPLLGERTDRFMPFLWTLFFFILVNNLLGLIPILDLFHLLSPTLYAEHRTPLGGTATQNLWVTAVLAAMSFVVINAAGVRELGVMGYLRHLTGGAPMYIWPILIPVEVLGTFIKPIALAIRLFANMTAGHILLATLFMFVGLSYKAGVGAFVPVSVLSLLGAIAVYFLEIFIAFLQAFVFMFLTTVFISQLSHHHDEHGAHEHVPAAAH